MCAFLLATVIEIIDVYYYVILLHGFQGLRIRSSCVHGQHFIHWHISSALEMLLRIGISDCIWKSYRNTKCYRSYGEKKTLENKESNFFFTLDLGVEKGKELTIQK